MKKNIFKTLAVTVLSAVSLTAWAVEPVSYLDGTGTEQTCTEYTVVESSSSAVTWNAGWYVVSGDVTIANSITFNGNVNLILCDGATLTITGDENEIGIDGYDGDDIYDLTVYGQSEGSGSMSVTGGPAINNVNYLTINGGELTVTGVFVGFDTGNGTVTINSGKLTVTSGGNAFNSEWGGYGDFGTVKINGGELTATGNTKVVHDFSVINAIAGTGWTDAAGTEGETAIAVSTEGQDLSAYKKVQFSAAANSPYAAYVNTTTAVHFNDYDWYIIEDNSTAVDAGTVTLLSKECVAASKYDSNGQSNTYSGSTVETAVNNYYTNSISSNVKTAIVDNKMFLLTKDQADATSADVRKCSKADGASENCWWLCSPGAYDSFAACVYGDDGYVYNDGKGVNVALGVRPALQLDLSKVTFDSATKTFSVAPTTSVATPTLSPADAAKSNIWYDLNGRHYQGKPTMQGVYINNHQKYVVK